jgi:hypothetical protein
LTEVNRERFGFTNASRLEVTCHRFFRCVAAYLLLGVRNKAKESLARQALLDGVDQFPYSRKMMIVVFGDKIQMVYQSHRRLQTRVGNGSSKK